VRWKLSRVMDLTTVVGLLAAFCTTVSYVPQLKKCWETGSAGDLSLKTFSILATGVALWVAYGVLKSDYVIILANTISLLFLAGILYFKFREGSQESAGKGALGLEHVDHSPESRVTCSDRCLMP
jgi:MtN3 and saliva related transmembrane protein